MFENTKRIIQTIISPHPTFEIPPSSPDPYYQFSGRCSLASTTTTPCKSPLQSPHTTPRFSTRSTPSYSTRNTPNRSTRTTPNHPDPMSIKHYGSQRISKLVKPIPPRPMSMHATVEGVSNSLPRPSHAGRRNRHHKSRSGKGSRRTMSEQVPPLPRMGFGMDAASKARPISEQFTPLPRMGFNMAIMAPSKDASTSTSVPPAPTSPHTQTPRPRRSLPPPPKSSYQNESMSDRRKSLPSPLKRHERPLPNGLQKATPPHSFVASMGNGVRSEAPPSPSPRPRSKHGHEMASPKMQEMSPIMQTATSPRTQVMSLRPPPPRSRCAFELAREVDEEGRIERREIVVVAQVDAQVVAVEEEKNEEVQVDVVEVQVVLSDAKVQKEEQAAETNFGRKPRRRFSWFNKKSKQEETPGSLVHIPEVPVADEKQRSTIDEVVVQNMVSVTSDTPAKPDVKSKHVREGAIHEESYPLLPHEPHELSPIMEDTERPPKFLPPRLSFLEFSPPIPMDVSFTSPRAAIAHTLELCEPSTLLGTSPVLEDFLDLNESADSLPGRSEGEGDDSGHLADESTVALGDGNGNRTRSPHFGMLVVGPSSSVLFEPVKEEERMDLLKSDVEPEDPEMPYIMLTCPTPETLHSPVFNVQSHEEDEEMVEAHSEAPSLLDEHFGTTLMIPAAVSSPPICAWCEKSDDCNGQDCSSRHAARVQNGERSSPPFFGLGIMSHREPPPARVVAFEQDVEKKLQSARQEGEEGGGGGFARRFSSRLGLPSRFPFFGWKAHAPPHPHKSPAVGIEHKTVLPRVPGVGLTRTKSLSISDARKQSTTTPCGILPDVPPEIARRGATVPRISAPRNLPSVLGMSPKRRFPMRRRSSLGSQRTPPRGGVQLTGSFSRRRRGERHPVSLEFNAAAPQTSSIGRRTAFVVEACDDDVL